MAADKFNSLTGYSVGLPPIDAIAANGNIVTNVNYPAGNVTSNVIRANTYLYANGAAFSSDPAGANTEIQFNNNGAFGASANLVFDTATSRIITRNATVLGENTIRRCTDCFYTRWCKRICFTNRRSRWIKLDSTNRWWRRRRNSWWRQHASSVQ